MRNLVFVVALITSLAASAQQFESRRGGGGFCAPGTSCTPSTLSTTGDVTAGDDLVCTDDVEVGSDVKLTTGNNVCFNAACTSFCMDNSGQLVCAGVSGGVRTTGALTAGGAFDPRAGIANASTEAPCSSNTGAVCVNDAQGLAVANSGTTTATLSASGALSVVTSAVSSTSTFTGLSTFTAGADMTNDLIVNVATPVSASDAATKGYVDGLATPACFTTVLWSVCQWDAACTHLSGGCFSTVNLSAAGARGPTVPVDFDVYTHCRLGYFGATAAAQTGTVTVKIFNYSTSTDDITTSFSSSTSCLKRSSSVTDLSANTGVDVLGVSISDDAAGDDPAFSGVYLTCCNSSSFPATAP
jgi:hypothetical protein